MYIYMSVSVFVPVCVYVWLVFCGMFRAFNSFEFREPHLTLDRRGRVFEGV